MIDFLHVGLTVAGASQKTLGRNVAIGTKISRFSAVFGIHPLVCTRLWDCLQEFDNERKLERFFLCLNWLKCYDKESVLAVRYDLSEKELRLWLWYYAECLSFLSQSLISMPESFDDRLHFPMVVDGTHCMIYEPMHELYPMDRDYFSHKHHTAAYAYQLTLSTRESKILSIHGPFPAGKFSDKAMWRHTGMEAFMVAQNKRAIADGGYEGMKGVAIPMRRYHSKLTGIYFRRNRARVERLMGYFKNFAVLDTTFRIRKERLRKHEIVFRAVAAIVATQLATENPIFAA